MAGNDEYTKLLIHSADEVDGSTNFIDSSASGHVITPGTGVTHSTDYAKFGTSCIKMTGSGALFAADSDDFILGDTYTIDAWYRLPSLAVPTPFWGQVVSNTDRIQLYLAPGGSTLLYGVKGSVFCQISWDLSGLPLNVFFHLEIGVASGVAYLFIDGVLQTANVTAGPGSVPDINAPFGIGFARAGSASKYLTGYVAEPRVSAGVIRHTENFTPPTEPYSGYVTMGKTISLMYGDIVTLGKTISLMYGDLTGSVILGKTISLMYGDLIGSVLRIKYADVPVLGAILRMLPDQYRIRGKVIRLRYAQARVLGSRLQLAYSSSVVMGKRIVIKYFESSGVIGKIIQLAYASTRDTVMGKVLRLAYASAANGYRSDDIGVTMTVVSTGKEIETIININTSANEGQYLWEVSMTITSEWEANLLDQWEAVNLNRYGTDYALKVVHRSVTQQVADDGFSKIWEVLLSSPTCQLDERFATKITQTWPYGSAAKAIVQELCDLYGVELDWQVPQYVIGELVAEQQAPIEIIRTVKNVIGAMIQTSPAGALIIRKEIPVLPVEGAAVDYTVTGLSINSVAEQPDDPKLLCNYVVVSNQDDVAAATTTLNHEEVDRSDGGKDIKAWAEPWQAVTITPNASAAEATATGQGIVEEEIDPTWIEFIEGKASVPKPVYADFKLLDHHGTDPGAISWNPDSKELEATAGGEHYCQVQYTWRYYAYIYYSLDGRDYQVVLQT